MLFSLLPAQVFGAEAEKISDLFISGACGGDVAWTFDETSKKLTISGTGEMTDTWFPYDWWDEPATFAPWHDFADQIESVVIEYGVTSVGHFAFYGCSSLCEISIPESVTMVGCAFVGSGLEEIYIPASVTDFCYPSNEGVCEGLTKIIVDPDNSVYSSDASGMLYNKSKTKFIGCPTGYQGAVSIADSVTEIGDFAFVSCEGVTTVSIPDSTVKLGMYAFIGCSNLEEIEFPANMSIIGPTAFSDCSKLTSLKIPASVTRIEQMAFSHCTSLQEIWFEGDAPFMEYDFLYGVAATAYYPAGNSTWTAQVFDDYGGTVQWVPYGGETNRCGDSLSWSFDESTGMLTITGSGDMWDFPSDQYTDEYDCPWADFSANITSVILDGEVTSIGDYAFFRCASLEEITGLDHVLRIGNSAFSGCLNLKEISLPSQLESIGNKAFDSTGLVSIEFPGSIKEIGEFVISNSWSLEEVVLSEGITTIGYGMFAACNALSKILLPETLIHIGDIAFNSCFNLKNISIPASVTEIGERTFLFCEELTEIRVDENNSNYSSDEHGVLFNKEKTTLIAAPGGLTDEYTISDTVADVIPYAFEACSLKSVTIMGDLSTISEGMFSDCTDLKKIEIPGSVTVIAKNAFANNRSLNDVYYNGTEKNWSAISIDAGNTYLTNATIHYQECNHSYTAQVTLPTCLEQGYTTYSCECGDSYVDDYVEPLGHDMGSWETIKESDCEKAGEQRRDCTRCEHYETQTIPASGHNYEALTTKPTCTEKGFTTYKCNCGDNYVADEADALGHDMGSWTITVKVKCDQDGEERSDCSRCEYFEKKTIPATGHKYTAQVTPSNCLDQGYTTYTCDCGDSYVDGYVEPLDHNMGDWKITRKPECDEPGELRRDCSRCEHYELLTVHRRAFNGHTYEMYDLSMNWTDAKAFCENLGGYLVTITSEKEQKFIETLVEKGAKKEYWIGAYDENGNYRWVTGEAFSYTNWAESEPNRTTHGNRTEAYVHLYNVINPAYGSNGRLYTWNDMFENNIFETEEYIFSTEFVGFICEYGDFSIDGTENSYDVTYFHSWDAENQIAYFGDEDATILFSLGYQVTEETDTSFLTNVDSLVGHYVLAKTKVEVIGAISKSVLLSIKPLVTKTGKITVLDNSTITFDNGETYTIPESLGVLTVSVGDTVMYHLYEGELVGINGVGSAEPGDGDSTGDEKPEEPDSTEDEYRIEVYSIDRNLTVKPGQELQLLFALYCNDELVPDWDGLSWGTSDGDIIKVASYDKIDTGYRLFIKGLQEGTATFNIMDGNLKAAFTLEIKVTNQHATPFGCSIDNVPSRILDVFGDKGTQVNFYNVNGLFVSDYWKSDKPTNGKYTVKFNVYSHSYMHGSVDIYDANDNWIGSKRIDKNQNVRGIVDTAYKGVVMVAGWFSGDGLSYQAVSYTKETKITFEVPVGGRFVISNNIAQSPGVFVYNTIDAYLQVLKAACDGLGDTNESQIKKIQDLTVEKLLESDAFYDAYQKAMVDMIIDIPAVALQKGYVDAMTGIVDLLLEYAGETVNMVISSAFNIAEDVFKAMIPPQISVWFDLLFGISEVGDALGQSIDISRSPLKSYIVIYTPQASDKMIVQGVTAVPDKNVLPANAKLSVSRISTGEALSVPTLGVNTEKYQLFDISFISDGVEVQPSGKVKIHLPVPVDYGWEAYQILHQRSDGNWEVLDSHIEGENIVVEVDSFSLFAIIEGTSEPHKLGDVNQDDKINAMDATRILRYAAKLITEDKIDLTVADVNGDGRVNAMDATRILRYVAKLIPALR